MKRDVEHISRDNQPNKYVYLLVYYPLTIKPLLVYYPCTFLSPRGYIERIDMVYIYYAVQFPEPEVYLIYTFLKQLRYKVHILNIELYIYIHGTHPWFRRYVVELHTITLLLQHYHYNLVYASEVNV